jgi:hypothetical protein
MAINLETALTNGLLAELAYLKLENNWFFINNKNNKNIDDIKEFLDSSKINNGKLLSDKEYEDLTGIQPEKGDRHLFLKVLIQNQIINKFKIFFVIT